MARDTYIATFYKRDFVAAWRAMRNLLNNKTDTGQVFIIMRSLNGSMNKRGYERLLKHPGGGRIAYVHTELVQLFSNETYLASFAPGTVGAAYRDFLYKTGYSAAELASYSKVVGETPPAHPYAWYGRRFRDVHDVWHVLIDYQVTNSLSEHALAAFCYAQSGGLGWGFLALMPALKSLRVTRGIAYAKTVLEGWKRGRQAQWLPGEDYETLMHEPLIAARERLGLTEPLAYKAALAKLGEDFNISTALSKTNQA